MPETTFLGELGRGSCAYDGTFGSGESFTITVDLASLGLSELPAGTFVAVVMGCAVFFGTGFNISDTRGNSWTTGGIGSGHSFVPLEPDVSIRTCIVAAGKEIQDGDTLTITAPGQSATISGVALAFSGGVTSGDLENFNAATNSTSLTAGSRTFVGTGYRLAIGTFVTKDSVQDPALTFDADWNALTSQDVAVHASVDTNYWHHFPYWRLVPVGTYNAGATADISVDLWSGGNCWWTATGPQNDEIDACFTSHGLFTFRSTEGEVVLNRHTLGSNGKWAAGSDETINAGGSPSIQRLSDNKNGVTLSLLYADGGSIKARRYILGSGAGAEVTVATGTLVDHCIDRFGRMVIVLYDSGWKVCLRTVGTNGQYGSATTPASMGITADEAKGRIQALPDGTLHFSSINGGSAQMHYCRSLSSTGTGTWSS